MVTVSGARVGVARTPPLTLGITGGVALMFVAMAIGLGALLERAPWLSTALRVASATLPAWIARKILTAGPLDPDDERPLLGWMGGAAFQWVDPKAWAMTGSAATLHRTAGLGVSSSEGRRNSDGETLRAERHTDQVPRASTCVRTIPSSCSAPKSISGRPSTKNVGVRATPIVSTSARS